MRAAVVAAMLLAPNAMPPSPLHARTHSPTQRNPAATQPTSTPSRPDAKKRPAMWIGLLIGGLLGLLAALLGLLLTGCSTTRGGGEYSSLPPAPKHPSGGAPAATATTTAI